MESFLQIYREEVEMICEVCHKLSENKYVTGQGGNLAQRVDDNLIIITPTQMNKGDIMPEDLVCISATGEQLFGSRKMTGEAPIYLNMFRKRPDVRSVLHCHLPYAGAFTLTKGKNWLERPFFPETVMEVGPVPLVPYETPLSEKLARQFDPYLDTHNAFLMENHGFIIVSPFSIRWAYSCTELLEQSAVSLLQALQLDPSGTKEIGREGLKELDEIMKRRNLPMFGRPGKNHSLTDVY